MNKILQLLVTGVAGIVFSGQLQAQSYCTPSFQDGCSWGDQIYNASTQNGLTNFSNLASGCSSGYYSYNQGMVVTQEQGQSFDLTVQGGPSYDQGFKVWIDWNQDMDYADPGEDVYTSPSWGVNPYTTTITVPSTAAAGLTRMRIRCDYWSIPTDPCAYQYYGEVEEYDVMVLPPITNDAGVAALDSPAVPACVIGNQVYVTLNNYGSNNLTSATINWSVNGVNLTPVSWTGSIAQYNTASAFVGSYGFSSGDVLKVWTTNPNGVADQFTMFDTVTVTLHPALSGVYTIGGSSPDYNTYNDAVNDLMAFGVCSTVVFVVATGTYNEQISIGNVLGASSVNTVTFRSASGNNTDVTLTFTGTGTGDNYTVRLNNSSWLRFEDMTIENPGTYYGRAVVLNGTSNWNIFQDNRLLSDTFTTSGWSDQQVVYFNNGKSENNLFDGNEIAGGSQGIYMATGNSTSKATGNVIQNNEFKKNYYQSIYLEDQHAPKVHANKINSDNADPWGYRIYLYRCTEGIEVTSNNIGGMATGTGIYMDNSGGNSAVRALVANNFIDLGDPSAWSDCYGFNSWQTGYTDIINNSIHLETTSTWNTGMYVDGALNRVINNNLYLNTAGGTGISYWPAYAVMESDNNNFYAPTASTWGNFNGGNASDLSSWQSLTSMDANSISVDPLFVSTDDLHTCSPDLYKAGKNENLPSDIDNDLRTSVPSIGADEFIAPSVFDMGPDTMAKCENAILTVGPGIAGTTYAWSNGMTTPTIDVSLPGTYSVIVTNSCGSGNDEVTVVDKPMPVANFTENIVYLAGVFTNTSTGNPTSYFWDFGDGGTSILSDPTYLFQHSGFNTVTLIVENDCGTDTLVKEINIQVIGVDEEEDKMVVTVNPNPSNGLVTLAMSNLEGAALLNVTDMQGKLIMNREIRANGTYSDMLDFRNLAQGVYFLRITSDKGQTVHKLVIE